MALARKEQIRKETKHKIQMLRELEGRCRTSRGSLWFLAYLEEVFRYFRKIRKCSRKKRSDIRSVLNSSRLKKLTKVKRRSLFRRILDATTKSPHSTRSRWTLGLKYINAKRKVMEKVGFAEFVTTHGGISGCERLWRELQSKKTKQKIKQARAGASSVSRNIDDDDDEDKDW